MDLNEGDVSLASPKWICSGQVVWPCGTSMSSEKIPRLQVVITITILVIMVILTCREGPHSQYSKPTRAGNTSQ